MKSNINVVNKLFMDAKINNNWINDETPLWLKNEVKVLLNQLNVKFVRLNIIRLSFNNIRK